MLKKKVTLVITSLIILTTILTGCSTQLNSGGVMKTINYINQYTHKDQIPQAINSLGYNIVKEINLNKPGNIIFSPVSLSSALAMATNGAVGKTKEEMLKALGTNEQDINEGYLNLINKINEVSSDNTILSTANSAWFNKDIVIKPEYEKVLEDYFIAQTNNVDFSDLNTKNAMNKWIENNTEGLLKDVIKETDPQNTAVLMNTLYFKGLWVKDFNKKQTYETDFNLADGNSKKVNMMVGSFKELYYEDKSCQIVSLSYDDVTMYIVLPKDDINKFIKSEDYLQLDEKINNCSSEHVDIQMPKIKYKNSTDLIPYLKNIGISRAFSSDAEFDNISDTNMLISKVKQDAIIDINEEGTEAAAVTIIEMKCTSALIVDKYEVICNKPYMFMIKENQTGVNLFQGIVRQPE